MEAIFDHCGSPTSFNYKGAAFTDQRFSTHFTSFNCEGGTLAWKPKSFDAGHLASFDYDRQDLRQRSLHLLFV